MSAITDFLEKAKQDYAKFEADLAAFQDRVDAKGEKAEAWAKEQVEKLKGDLTDARAEVDKLGDQIAKDGEAAAASIHAEAEKHWEALRAAVATFRTQLNPEAGASGDTAPDTDKA